VTQIVQAHYTDQRVCIHERPVFAIWRQSNGVDQVVSVCSECGFKLGNAQPHAEHPHRATYPRVNRHPDPCPCHPATGLRAQNRQVNSADYAEYLQSDRWKAKRAYYLNRALGRCQLCNKAGGPNGRGLHVHHRTYDRVGAELDADVIVLCRECHERHHDHIAEHAA
jgi:5-methylcytosine-specific restriction endonuclease McrA